MARPYSTYHNPFAQDNPWDDHLTPPDQLADEWLPPPRKGFRTAALRPVANCLQRFAYQPQLESASEESNAQPRRRVSSFTCLQLSLLLKKSRQLRWLNRVLQAFLPPAAQPHVVLISIGTRFWLLQVDSSVWATRLKFQLPMLQQQIATYIQKEVPTLRIKVAPFGKNPTPTKTAAKASRHISPATAQHLQQLADQLPHSPELTSVLRRLAQYQEAKTDV